MVSSPCGFDDRSLPLPEWESVSLAPRKSIRDRAGAALPHDAQVILDFRDARRVRGRGPCDPGLANRVNMTTEDRRAARYRNVNVFRVMRSAPGQRARDLGAHFGRGDARLDRDFVEYELHAGYRRHRALSVLALLRPPDASDERDVAVGDFRLEVVFCEVTI